MAKIKSFSVRDTSGLSNVGVGGETISVTLSLDEAVTVTNGTINLNTVILN
jgi:hypothetical protein